ncbi:MAG: class I tRNA ligase family protein [Patescibacteria group bacterium]
MQRKLDFKDLEHQIMNFWKDNNILSKYLHRNDAKEEKFSFLDGPITANNPMGVHHAWGRTLKDLYQRFKNMCGFQQRFQNGFDNQGLWVEVEVEKKLGFENKKDIEDFGIDDFVEKCKQHTKHFSQVQTEQSQRLGYFMDWGNDYYTMSPENNYAIWAFLKKVWEDGNLYKGRDSVPWCPRCGTAISQHEILTEEYKQLTHKSVFFKLPLKQLDGEKLTQLDTVQVQQSGTQFSDCSTISLLVWTTTPWTIPGNMAVAVDPELEYWLWRTAEDECLIFADPTSKKGDGPHFGSKEKSLEEQEDGEELNALDVVKEGEKLATLKGEDLVGLSYQAPYEHLSAVAKIEGKNKFKVVAADPLILSVDPVQGTGIVHIAPGCGSEDFKLGREKDIPALPVIDEAANYLDGFGDLTGKNAKQHPELVLDELMEESPFGFETVSYTHSYPTCWRCKSELVWRVVDEWYIAMDDERRKEAKDYRSRLKDVIKDVNWIPEFGYDRELDWLNNMEDWLISKKRYWGLCLPIWECFECGHFEVIGSRAELEKRAVNGWEEFAGHTPHRPYVDAVEIECSQCGEKMKRIEDVGNPWLDAGIVAYSTLRYFEDRDYWGKWFPADLVLECFPGQFKNWFYSLLAMSTVLEDKAPFETLLGHGLVKDEQGEEMHKSKGNAIWFDDAVEEMGADPMRWLYASQNPAQNLHFGPGPAREVKRRFLFILWNSLNFFVTYARLDNFDPVEKLAELKLNDSSEKQVGSDSGDTKNGLTLDTYEFSVLDKWVVSKAALLISQVTEYLENYRNHKAVEEIENFITQDLSTWYIRRIRDYVGPTAQEGERKDTTHRTLFIVFMILSKMLAPFIPFTAEKIFQILTANCKDSWLEDLDEEGSFCLVKDSVHLTDWPSYHDYLIDKDVLRKMKIVREICEQGHAARREAGIKIRQPLSEMKVYISPQKNIADHSEYVRVAEKELNIKNIEFESRSGDLEVDLDTKLNPQLRKEGRARELSRAIQNERREAGCNLDDYIVIQIPDTEENREAVAAFGERIKKNTLAGELVFGEDFNVLKVRPSNAHQKAT